MKRIALSKWVEQFDPPPSTDTVRQWAAAGTVKLWQGKPHGKIYVIEEASTAMPSTDDLVKAFRERA